MTLHTIKLAIWRKLAYEGLFGKSTARGPMTEPTVIKLTMPEGWKPGRCHYAGDITLSCPLSFAGCWVHKPENCPLVPKPAATSLAKKEG